VASDDSERFRYIEEKGVELPVLDGVAGLD
jgi:hypothetical protein